MNKTFLEQVYAVAADYTVNVTVGYSTTVIQVSSNKNPGLKKTSVTYLNDLPAIEERDNYLSKELAELVNKIKAEE